MLIVVKLKCNNIKWTKKIKFIPFVLCFLFKLPNPQTLPIYRKTQKVQHLYNHFFTYFSFSFFKETNILKSYFPFLPSFKSKQNPEISIYLYQICIFALLYMYIHKNTYIFLCLEQLHKLYHEKHNFASSFFYSVCFLRFIHVDTCQSNTFF